MRILLSSHHILALNRHRSFCVSLSPLTFRPVNSALEAPQERPPLDEAGWRGERCMKSLEILQQCHWGVASHHPVTVLLRPFVFVFNLAEGRNTGRFFLSLLLSLLLAQVDPVSHPFVARSPHIAFGARSPVRITSSPPQVLQIPPLPTVRRKQINRSTLSNIHYCPVILRFQTRIRS